MTKRQRIESIKTEITNLRCQKILLGRQYSSKVSQCPHYMNRRELSEMATITRKINKLKEINVRIAEAY
jgi:hypothetical protein